MLQKIAEKWKISCKFNDADTHGSLTKTIINGQEREFILPKFIIFSLQKHWKLQWHDFEMVQLHIIFNLMTKCRETCLF